MNRDPPDDGLGQIIGRAEIYLSLVGLACPTPLQFRPWTILGSLDFDADLPAQEPANAEHVDRCSQGSVAEAVFAYPGLAPAMVH